MYIRFYWYLLIPLVPEPTVLGVISVKLNRRKLDNILIQRIGQFSEHYFMLDTFTHSRKFIIAKKS